MEWSRSLVVAMLAPDLQTMTPNIPAATRNLVAATSSSSLWRRAPADLDTATKMGLLLSLKGPVTNT